MIRTDAEHAAAVSELQQQARRIDEYQATLMRKGLVADEIKRALDPLRSFHTELADEIKAYERLRSGQFEDTRNLHGLGRVLVALRIARGLSQRELAARLDVHESQVSRDERHEYHGITVERASRILDALNVTLRSTTEPLMPAMAYREPSPVGAVSGAHEAVFANDDLALAA